MIADEKIKNSSELEFAVFCIENVAAKLGVNAERGRHKQPCIMDCLTVCQRRCSHWHNGCQ